jgi:hypothetical protein
MRTNGLVNQALALGLFAAVGTTGCGITVARDLSATKPGEVVFDDMCGLQEYFDDLRDSTIAPPREVAAQEMASAENGKAVGGKTRFRFETEFQLHHLRKMLATNWGSLPKEVENASSLDVEVRWSEKAGVKRVVTDETATLGVGQMNHTLPYHVCLSDLLFGEDLYRTRRTVLELPPIMKSRFSKQPEPGANKPGPVIGLGAAMSGSTGTGPLPVSHPATGGPLPVMGETPAAAPAAPVPPAAPAAAAAPAPAAAPTPSPSTPAARAESTPAAAPAASVPSGGPSASAEHAAR